MNNKYEHEMQRRDCWIQSISGELSRSGRADFAAQVADSVLIEFDKRFKVQEESRPPHIPTLEEAHGAH